MCIVYVEYIRMYIISIFTWHVCVLHSIVYVYYDNMYVLYIQCIDAMYFVQYNMQGMHCTLYTETHCTRHSQT